MSAEPSNPSGLPGRNRPHLSDLSRETTEEDLWNLDEEEATAQPILPRQSKPAPAPPAKESLPVLGSTPESPTPRGLNSPVKRPASRDISDDEIGELDEEAPESTPATRPEPHSPAQAATAAHPVEDKPGPAAKATPAPKSPAPQPETTAPGEPQEGKSSPRENRPRGAASGARASIPGTRLKRREVIGIASFAVVALIASAWVLTRFFSLLTFTSDADRRPDYPLEGEHAQITSGSTFWREPVRTGENRDVARREVIIIPVLELTLDPEKSGGGSLRVIFRNAEGTPVGDAITRSFGAGRFESSDSHTASFAATDGFNAEGDFQAYRTGAGKLWVADVLEGPPGGTPASAFKKLSSIPIFPERR